MPAIILLDYYITYAGYCVSCRCAVYGSQLRLHHVEKEVTCNL